MSENQTVRMERPAHGLAQPSIPFALIAPATRARAREVLAQLAELTGFAVAAMSVVRPERDVIQLAEVVGADLSDADMEQTYLPLSEWGRPGDDLEEWGVWRFRPASATTEAETRFDWRVSPPSTPAAGDWHPAHSLVCEVRDENGNLRAALHLDAPLNGRVPAPQTRAGLSALGSMAIQSIAAIMDGEQARHRAELAGTARQFAEAAQSTRAEDLGDAALAALTSTFALDRISGYWFHTVEACAYPAPAPPASLRTAVIHAWRAGSAVVVPANGPQADAVLQLPVGDETTCYGVLILERHAPAAPWSSAEVAGAVGIGRDLGRRLTEVAVTHRLKREVEDLRAEVANRARIASAVAHDLASPLHAIRNYVELLDHPSVTSDEQRHTLLDALRNGTEQAAELAASLSLLNRVPEPGAPTTDLAPLLQETLDLHAPTAKAKDQELTSQITAPTLVSMTTVDLRRVLANLTSNALKYTPPGGRITVTVRHADGQAVLIWSDTGIGIAPHQLSRVFEEFYRSPDTFTQSQSGTGLGLPIVKRLVENADGTIRIESRLGAGTLVEVRLPLATSH